MSDNNWYDQNANINTDTQRLRLWRNDRMVMVKRAIKSSKLPFSSRRSAWKPCAMPENKTPEIPKLLKMARGKKKSFIADFTSRWSCCLHYYSTAAVLCNISENGFHDLIKCIKTRHAGRPGRGQMRAKPCRHLLRSEAGFPVTHESVLRMVI